MGKMTLKLHNALKATLAHLQDTLKYNILVYGKDSLNSKAFCQPISLQKAARRLLSCTRIDIKQVGFNPAIEQKIVEWLKAHIRFPTNRHWCNLVSAHNWLKYNIAEDLYILHLGIAHIDYYVVLREEYIRYFRSSAFGRNCSK